MKTDGRLFPKVCIEEDCHKHFIAGSSRALRCPRCSAIHEKERNHKAKCRQEKEVFCKDCHEPFMAKRRLYCPVCLKKRRTAAANKCHVSTKRNNDIRKNLLTMDDDEFLEAVAAILMPSEDGGAPA